ncbi:hypothetical protein BaRGS_00029588 [Batillaria attramentaria]|uniref:Uncharacterized protein n=1 Tax=Batillaria attramentaria TaxID=370345 RepID=A0ABD0JWV6_9CAEN
MAAFLTVWLDTESCTPDRLKCLRVSLKTLWIPDLKIKKKINEASRYLRSGVTPTSPAPFPHTSCAGDNTTSPPPTPTPLSSENTASDLSGIAVASLRWVS